MIRMVRKAIGGQAQISLIMKGIDTLKKGLEAVVSKITARMRSSSKAETKMAARKSRKTQALTAQRILMISVYPSFNIRPRKAPPNLNLIVDCRAETTSGRMNTISGL